MREGTLARNLCLASALGCAALPLPRLTKHGPVAMLGGMEESVDSERIDYPRIIQEALRDVVRRVLAQVAGHGLPGDHHFLVAFRTDHPGVRVPQFLRDMYPDEIKIMLQHQYWDLEVDEEAFSVTLSFSAARHRLTVP